MLLKLTLLLFVFVGAFSDCFFFKLQVCNPAMQFMLYETMLSKLKKKRALKGSTNVTALEVQTLYLFFCLF